MAVPYSHVRMDLMHSKEISISQKKGTDLVILPVGCFEMHGPNIPLACDAYTEWAAAVLLADCWQGLALPPVFYSFAGATAPWSGTVDIPPEVTFEYVKAIVISLHNSGFKRIVLAGGHGPLVPLFKTLCSSLFQSSQIAILSLNIYPDIMPADLMEKELGYPWGEDIQLAAAFSILGIDADFNPETKLTKNIESFNSVYPKFQNFAKNVFLPGYFTADYQHAGLRTAPSAEDIPKAVEIMEQGAARMKPIAELFKEYLQELEHSLKEKPWENDNWSI
jgi:hypothetical protein